VFGLGKIENLQFTIFAFLDASFHDGTAVALLSVLDSQPKMQGVVTETMIHKQRAFAES